MCANVEYLEQFKLENDKVYSISVGDGPSSIRDQIQKAARFIEAANAKGLVGPGRRLLVVGAGVTGLAASWHAVRLGTFTKLQDTETTPVSRQANCHTRWLHPYAYDWPNKHWQIEEFPSLGEAGIPDTLPWESKLASGVARSWVIRFNAWAAKKTDEDFNLFEWLPERRVTIPPLDCVDWDSWRKGIDPEGIPDMILICAGAAERCTEPQDAEFRSYRFWADDPYEEEFFGGETKPGYLVLVSGGGDGALQDFLRILCRQPNSGRFVHVVFLLTGLKSVLERLEPYHRLCDQLRGDANGFRPSPDVVWQACNTFLEEIMTSSERDALEAVLDDLINPRFLRGGEDHIHLNLPEEEFGGCLPLNAFLVRLFAWRLEGWNKTVFFPNAKLTEIVSAEQNHTCAEVRGPGNCVTKRHLVRYIKNGVDVRAEYDVVVIRHGIKPVLPARSGRGL